jgi:hypothetical protein
MPDTLNDVFWMLTFSSKKQAQTIQQEDQVTDEEMQSHRDLITAEHRLPPQENSLSSIGTA